MPALMAQRSSSMRNEIRRELERRRKSIDVAKGRVVKKSSGALPRRLIPSAGSATLKLANAPAPKERVPPPRVLIPTGAPGTERNKITYMDLGDAPKRLTQRREAPLIASAMKASKQTALIPRAPAAAMKLSTRTEHDHETTEAETKPSSAPIEQPHPSSILVKKGMTVKMRMPAGTLPTGQRLVILHDAVVVSDVEDGYVEVVCKGNAGRTVRIALDQVKTTKR
ncbi:unnamed protein product [Alopecurus aequalis]